MLEPEQIPVQLVAVVVDDRAAVGRVVSWTSVAGASANLGELSTAVVEQLVVDGCVRTELFFSHSPTW